MKVIKYGEFKKRHRTDWHDFLWNIFLGEFADVKSRIAIDAIFSVYEKRLVTKRLAALALIREGMSIREIGRLLWLSRNTTSALKKSFFGSSGGYKSPRSFKKSFTNKARTSVKISENSWLDQLFGDIDLWELIKNPPRPIGTGIKKINGSTR